MHLIYRNKRNNVCTYNINPIKREEKKKNCFLPIIEEDTQASIFNNLQ